MMDKKYWEDFYKKQNEELNPSLFAKYILNNKAKEHLSLIELGCGNGRDSIYCANNNLNVLAIDQCEHEINFLQQRYNQLKNIQFKCADFTNLDSGNTFDIIYSRFTLHSVTKSQEEKVLAWALENISHNGIFCIEVRGFKNEIYGLGKPVDGEENAYIYDNHYRRFLDFFELHTSLTKIGFNIEFAAEDKDFAPYNEKNETFIRVIAKKI